jgi:GNAT superfamily N-acetyltransferase
LSGAAGVVLRSPAAADADAMLALVEICSETYRDWAPDGWEPPPRGSAHWVRELAAGGAWTRVAVDPDRRIVGLVSWSLDLGEGYVGALFVEPRRWRTGIGARLLDAAEAAMRAAGCARAQLTTLEGAPAEAFYRARGWSHDGREGFHSLFGLPFVGYAREL